MYLYVRYSFSLHQSEQIEARKSCICVKYRFSVHLFALNTDVPNMYIMLDTYNGIGISVHRVKINAWMFKLYILGASWVNFNSLKSLSGARMTIPVSKSETSAGWLLAHLKGRAVSQRKTAPGLSTPHLRCSVSASGAPTRTLQQQQTDTRTLFCLRSLDFTVRELF